MSQTRAGSRAEVGIDTLLMVLTNLCGQWITYGALATTGRALSFLGATIAVASTRRYMTRRLFNRLLHSVHQTRQQSALEVSVDTVIAMVLSMGLQVVWYGAAATLARAGTLTLAVYALTLVRRYALRRLFEFLATRQAHRLALRPAQTQTPKRL